MNNHWKHKYFEKSTQESHANIFRSLEIEQYLKQILKNNGFNLHKCNLNFSNFIVNIFLSVYKTEQKTPALKKSVQLNEDNSILQKKKIAKFKRQIKKHYLRKSFAKRLTNKLRYARTLRSYKNCSLELENNKTISFDSLPKKILESLSSFTNNNFNVNLTIREINFINSSSDAERALLTFRKFERTPFFKEGKSLLVPLITRRNSAKLLGTFIAAQLETIKRHNFFFNFLQESLALIMGQKLSKVQGIKILIAGRLNNAARSRNKIIKIGKISLLEINSKIDYSETTAFTSNGTFGVKVWICEKD
jgi:ribosomal protein S3